jgi:hypothetical protein
MRRSRGVLAAIIGAAMSFVSSGSPADEQIFGYLYTPDTLPKGSFEFEQWVTANYKQSQGDYLNLPMRSELEYGFTDDFQGSIYLNYSYINAYRNGVSGETGGLGIPQNANPDARFTATRWDSVSAEFIYRILSAYKDPLGFGVYFEPAYGPRESELEGKLLFQKNFLEDRLVFAMNLNFEWEWEKKTGKLDPEGPEAATTERESNFELQLGASYLFVPGWRAGLEYRNVNHYVGHTLFSQSNKEWQASFLGPNIHYGAKDWWMTLAALMQLRNAKGYNEEFQENIVSGRVYGDAATRYGGIRMRVGYNF